MRTAIISDIHGNYDGLMSVLRDIGEAKCDRVLCLGDLVDGGENSVEVVRHFREHNLACVQGNHDEYPNTDLPYDVIDFLQSLPKEIAEGDVLYTHTSPRRKQIKIANIFEAWNVFEETDHRRIFVGDVHIPLVFGHLCQFAGEAQDYEIPYSAELKMAPDDRYIVCVGSLGYSRDPYAVLRYAIYDSEQDSVIFRAPVGPILVF